MSAEEGYDPAEFEAEELAERKRPVMPSQDETRPRCTKRGFHPITECANDLGSHPGGIINHDDPLRPPSQDETREPYIVEPGWVRSDYIAHGGGPSYRLLTYEDGTVRFEHRCDRGDRGVIVCAPALCIGPYAGGPGGTHTLTRNANGEPTVRASVLCPDCGTHGFITDGRWSA